MEFKKWLLNEMPIRNWKQIPENPAAWSRDAKRNYGWDKKDAGILSSESGIQKFKHLWANTEHNFDFYLVRTKEGNKFREFGKIDTQWVLQNLKIQIDPAPDAVTYHRASPVASGNAIHTSVNLRLTKVYS